MEQDLFGWLNSQRNSQGTGLLVAPMIPESAAKIPNTPPESEEAESESTLEAKTPDDLPSFTEPHEEIPTYPNESEKAESESALEAKTPDMPAFPESHKEIQTYTRESEEVESESALEVKTPDDLHAFTEPHEEIPTYPHESEYAEPESALEAKIPDLPTFPESHEEIPIYPNESEKAESDSALEATTPDDVSSFLEPHEEITTYPRESEQPESESDSQSQIPYSIPAVNEAFAEIAPRPQESDSPDNLEPEYQNHEWQERATGFTLSLDEPPPELWTNINNDDDDPDYEPTDSLQGAAYVQIHGRNFTERLHHTLKHRKERAEERALLEPEPDPINPLKQIAVILCGTLVMALGFALLTLWFVGRETPQGMKSRAEALVEAGQYDEAAEIYRKAHRRYPTLPEFLEGLAQSSLSAGHVQTAKTAREEYIRLTSPDIPQTPPEPPKPEPQIPVTPAPVSIPITEKPLTFDDCMSEANHAYNIGMYTRALQYFSRAMKLNPRDFRPYIGLSASYRMKGWYVDSMHILEEARRKFGRSPALDMELYFLQEAK